MNFMKNGDYQTEGAKNSVPLKSEPSSQDSLVDLDPDFKKQSRRNKKLRFRKSRAGQ
jgi:hypothetical protein